MLVVLVEEVVAAQWPVTQGAIDTFLAGLGLARGDAAPGHTGRAHHLTGERDLAADYLIVHEFEGALVGFHALANGPAAEIQALYEQSVAELEAIHGPPEKAYDRRRPPSEVSQWDVGERRVALFAHADHHSPARTIQLAIEDIDRAADTDDVADANETE